MIFPEHLNLTRINTPIQRMDGYFNPTIQKKIWLKRDDLTGLELSGNKVRKLDFLFARAQSEGCERIITCGGIQSNHCRATAFYATKLGLKTTLVLKGSKPEQMDGNFFLNHLAGVEIQFISDEDYKKIDLIMRELSEESKEKSYIIPEGGSNHIGALGYAKCFEEIQEQFNEMNQPLDTIVFATGSGGTHAGLLAAKLAINSPVNIISVNVCDTASFFRDKIKTIIRNMVSEFNIKIRCDDSDVHIIDGFTGEGYGAVSAAEVAVIRRLAKSDGILIDPVYGAKALHGFEVSLERDEIPGDNILFIHTGGIFGLFPYWSYFV